MSTRLYEKLIEHAQACNVHASASPYVRFKAMWELYTFLNDTEGLDVFVSLGVALSEMESQLTEDQKREMSLAGYVFPEDWDNPREHFHGDKA